MAKAKRKSMTKVTTTAKAKSRGKAVAKTKTSKTKTSKTKSYERMSAPKEVEKMSAATGQTADIIGNCYLTAVKRVQDYNNKLIEYTHANTKTAFDFAQRMSGVKSPSEFVELSTELAQQQLMTLTEQTKQLAALAQQVTLATAEPLKTSLVPSTT
jgi:hypothetical protein